MFYVFDVLKFLSESCSTHAIHLTDLFDAAHPLTILLHLNSVTNYYDVYSPSIAEYVNEEIPKIHFIVG